MSVLVYIEGNGNELDKKSFELASYAAKTAAATNVEADALLIGEYSNAEELGNYGIRIIYTLGDPALGHFDSQSYAKAIADSANQAGANTIILGHNAHGKALIGRLAVRMQADSISGAIAVPRLEAEKFLVKKGVFSGKAFAEVELSTTNKVISLMGNSIQVEKSEGTGTLKEMELEIQAPKTFLLKTEVSDGEIPLPEAARVISAGRGMKAAENWGIIEELATELNAATACSRPVADTGWRPHHEHVGQTGLAIRPNLYIAIGISGAIQHLAGVNNSKTIVVINKDPEAPFFKAADYGVLADLFDVVPKLTEAVKKFNANN